MRLPGYTGGPKAMGVVLQLGIELLILIRDLTDVGVNDLDITTFKSCDISIMKITDDPFVVGSSPIAGAKSFKPQDLSKENFSNTASYTSLASPKPGNSAQSHSIPRHRIYTLRR